MRIISWNVQGTKKAQVLQKIYFQKRIHKPQIVFLSDTLVNKKNILDYPKWDLIILIMLSYLIILAG